jgi:hypothetical protein
VRTVREGRLLDAAPGLLRQSRLELDLEQAEALVEARRARRGRARGLLQPPRELLGEVGELQRRTVLRPKR